MTARTSRSFRLRACAVCKGDAFLDLSDAPEWRCLQCGRVAPPQAVPAGTGDWNRDIAGTVSYGSDRRRPSVVAREVV